MEGWEGLGELSRCLWGGCGWWEGVEVRKKSLVFFGEWESLVWNQSGLVLVYLSFFLSRLER